MRERFRLLGELGRHEESAVLVEQLCFESNPTQHLVVAEILADQATGYPDSVIRAKSADSTRIVASRHLGQDGQNRQQLLSTVARLAPEDRLLRRDCQLFGQPRIKRSLPVRHRSALHSVPRLVHTISLPDRYRWSRECV